MNKQEAIEEIKKQSTQAYDDFAIMRDTAIHIVSQIHEPQTVVVPEFVASWLEYAKEKYCTLRRGLCLGEVDTYNYAYWSKDEVKLLSWMSYKNNQETFARAWLDGYVIEQEKLYTVEIPDPNSYCNYRYLSRNNNGICLDASNDNKWKQKKINQFTEAEIKQDFEWAWQFAKEVENGN